MEFEDAIRMVCNDVAEFLVEKNRSYGNSVLEPIKGFSRADAKERMNVRLDDKLSRIIRGHEYPGDDTKLDIIGYLILDKAIDLYMEHHDEVRPLE